MGNIKLRIKKDDNVLVLSGKDRGKSGHVMTVFPDSGQIVVKGVNLVKKHVKKSKKFPKGGRVELPGKIDASNVLLICPHCKKTTRVSYRIDKKEKTRICKKCGKTILGKAKI